VQPQLAQSTAVLPGPLDERSAITRARRGDHDAFRLLVAQHQARIYGIALRLTGMPDAALQLAQEVCIELRAALPRIASPGHLTRWLLRETTRRVLQRLRQHAATGQAASVASAGDLPPRRLLLQLPPEARAIVLLRYQEGLDPAEIAAVLEVTPPLVAHSLERSLDWMATQGSVGGDELEQQLRSSLVAPDPGPEFTERVLAHTELRRSHRRRAAFAAAGSGRKRSRFVLAGSILVVALGALWLVLQLSGRSLLPDVAQPVAMEPAQPGAEALPAPAQATPASQAQAVAAPAALMQPRDAYPRYTVIAAPLRQMSDDPAAWPLVEAFHAALLDELRKVPEVTLLVPGLTAPPTDVDRPADFLLIVTSLPTAVLPAGAEGFRVTDGTRNGTGLATLGEAATGTVLLPAARIDGGLRWPVEIRIQPISQPQAQRYTSVVQVGADSAQLAAQQMQMLRARFFPDVLARQRLATTIRDSAQPVAERNRALSELLGALQRAHGAGFDSSAASTITDYAAMLPAEQRAEVWRRLRGLPHADLIAGLVESLRRDPDQQVRFEALATLAADYPNDVAARDAIASVAAGDSEEVIRMAARRITQGDADWRTWLVTRLGNTGLPPDERLGPLLLVSRSATTAAEVSDLQTLVHDPQIVRELLQMLGDGWFDPMQLESTADALGLLAHTDRPAAFDLQVQVPRTAAPLLPPPEGPAQPPPQKGGPERPQTVVSAANMAWLQAHQGNPRVRRMLQDIESGRMDPRLNMTIEQMRRLEQRGFPRLPPR
jgi:RNA polymerase sigma-70 factor (ECF subfamily)